MNNSKTLSQKAIMLAGVNAINIVFRTMLPFILVRVFTQEEFGQYMSIWLIASTAMVLTPLGMKNALFYFLPRHETQEKKVYIANVIIFMFFTGGLYSVLVFFSLSSGQELSGLSVQKNLLVPAFIFLWVISSLIDSLPNAEQKQVLQSKYLLYLGISRTLIIISSAVVTNSVEMVYLALLVFAFVKSILLFVYCYKSYGASFFLVKVNNLIAVPQIKYSVPFGIGGIFTQLRPQIEHWVVLFFLSITNFAIFSVITTIESVFTMAKSSIAQVILPSMSKHEKEGNINEIMRLNKKMNLIVFSFVVPCAIYFEIYADDIISFVFTNQYLDAIYLIRIYLIGIIFSSLDFQNVLMISRQGKYIMKVSIALMFMTSIVSSVAAILYGLIGIAIFSVGLTIVRQLFYLYKLNNIIPIKFKQLQNWAGYITIIFSASVSGVLLGLLKYNKLYQSYFNYILIEYIITLIVFFLMYCIFIKLISKNTFNSIFNFRVRKRV